MNPKPMTTFVITFQREGPREFECVVVHAHSKAEAISYARGTLPVATLPITSVYSYDPFHVGALFGLPYTVPAEDQHRAEFAHDAG